MEAIEKLKRCRNGCAATAGLSKAEAAERPATHARGAMKIRITFRGISHGTDIRWLVGIGRGGSAGVAAAARHGGGTRDRGVADPPSGTLGPERCGGEPERG